MAKNKAKQVPSPSPDSSKKKQRWMSTYGLMTAESMLKRYEVSFSPKDLIAQASDPKSFYHWMLKLPVLNAYNDIVRNQVRSRQSAAQALMIDYIYSDKLPEDQESAAGLEMRQQIESKRQALVDLGNELNALDERHWASFAVIDDFVLDQLEQWQSVNQKKAEEICQVLRGDGVDLPDDFAERLYQLLDKQAIGCELTEQQLQRYKLTEQPSPALRAVLSLLHEND